MQQQGTFAPAIVDRRGHGNSRSVIRRYRGGLVQQLAYGGGDKHGREFNHYASSQNNTGSGVI